MKNKKIFFVLFFVFLAKLSSAQVGIYTEQPEAALDNNGNLMIRSVPTDTISNDILVLNDNNILSKRSISDLVSAQIALTSYVKATADNSQLIDTIPVLGWYKMSVPDVDFDENNDYDSISSHFTAPEDGLYNIYVNLKLDSILTKEQIGVGILKKDFATSEYSLLAGEIYYNSLIYIGSSYINPSPLIRTTETIEKLKKGDIIFFGVKFPPSQAEKADLTCAIYQTKKEE